MNDKSHYNIISNNLKTKTMKQNCIRCNTEFVTKTMSQKFCSSKCRMAISNEKYRNKFKPQKSDNKFFSWAEYGDRTVIV
jgi:hypothetical protein